LFSQQGGGDCVQVGQGQYSRAGSALGARDGAGAVGGRQHDGLAGDLFADKLVRRVAEIKAIHTSASPLPCQQGLIAGKLFGQRKCLFYRFYSQNLATAFSSAAMMVVEARNTSITTAFTSAKQQFSKSAGR
jgi:hypothetical protein